MVHRNFVDGSWLEGVAASRNFNPSNTVDVVGEYAQADAAQAQSAVAAAKAAFPGWRAATPQQRADALDRIGIEILARKDELGRLLSREEGKTLPEGVGEPIGVVGLITPWNFPVAIPAWKIAPALAFGNCVVFKPADLVPGSAWALAEIISRAGLPAGVFNLVMGRGREVGQTLVDHPLVHALSFTGSVSTGERILQSASARRASSGALSERSSQPSRIFSVTGTRTASTVASMRVAA